MVDAATGGRAILGRGIEKIYLGVPRGPLEFLNFDSEDLGREDKENASQAITGNEGEDRGTPADISFKDKLKYALTPSRFLFDCVAAWGKPASVTPVGGGPLDSTTFAVTAAGSASYTTGQVVTVTDPTGSGAVVHVVASAGHVTGFTLVSAGKGYTSPTLDLTGIGDGTATGTVEPAVKAWLVKIRPSRTNEVRGASLYLFEGGSYSASLQTGRRAADMTLADNANKRVDVTVTYSDPTGDTITGFAVGKSSNSDAAWQGDMGLKIATRGRRPYDSNFDAGKSFYLKVTAASSDQITVKVAIDDASGATNGSGFPTPTFSTATIDIPVVDGSTDGFVPMIDPNGLPFGLMGENYEPFEISFGSDLTNLAVNDIFEFPVAMPALTKSVNVESRLSAFHLLRKIGGTTDVRIDKGTTKLTRPYKPYKANGRRIPQAIDPTGDSGATFSFSKRLYDRYFRAKADAHSRFTLLDVYKVESPITGTDSSDPATSAFESVEIFAPQCAVTGLKSGDIATKNVLEETITLKAEQPDVAPSAPSGFDSSAAYPFQINITTTVDPTWLD